LTNESGNDRLAWHFDLLHLENGNTWATTPTVRIIRIIRIVRIIRFVPILPIGDCTGGRLCQHGNSREGP
jgi:hypothetical protein